MTLDASDLKDLKLGRSKGWPSPARRFRHIQQRIASDDPFWLKPKDRWVKHLSIDGATFLMKSYSDADVMEALALKGLQLPEPVEAYQLELQGVSWQTFAGRVSPVDGQIRRSKELARFYPSRWDAEKAARRVMRRVKADYRQAIELARAA